AVAGRCGSTGWVTTVTPDTAATGPAQPTLAELLSVGAEPVRSPGRVTYSPGSRTAEEWLDIVTQAVERIRSGALDKVVLAREVVARTSAPVDPRWLLQRLAGSYPGCWTFSVDGMVGATPELLVRSEKGLAISRVLAGTVRRTGDDDADLAHAAHLTRSSKDLEEHEYAVSSVARELEPFCTSMNVPEAPFVLHLPNVMHLAT